MPDSALPYRSNPEVMMKIAHALSDGDKSKDTLYNVVDENRRTVRHTIDYGRELNLLEESSGDEITLNNEFNANVLSVSDMTDSGVKRVFQQALREYEPYGTIIGRFYRNDSPGEVQGKECMVKRQAMEHMNLGIETERDEEIAGQAAITLLRTLDAADLGRYVRGKRGYESRLVLNDDFEEFAREMSNRYTEEEADSQMSLSDTASEGYDFETFLSITEDGIGRPKIEIEIKGETENEMQEFIQDIDNVVQKYA